MATKPGKHLRASYAGLSLLATWLLFTGSMLLATPIKSLAETKKKITIDGVAGESTDDKHKNDMMGKKNKQPTKNVNSKPKQSNRRK